jgi:uncharacterized protein with NRDE domain
MCLLIFSHRVDPRYPLVLAANRDEFHARPTTPAGFWPQYPQLLAGRDLEQGGTWMGMTRNGRFSAITNCRDPARTAPAPRSRGELPLDFLLGDEGPEAYLHSLLSRAHEYAGFNLLVGSADELWYLTNSHTAELCEPVVLAPGLYGLSNAQLDTPWPKVVLGKQRLQTLLGKDRLAHNALEAVVADRQLADSTALQQLGLTDDMAQTLSSQFITTASYGTRSSTTLWTDRAGQAHWRESTFDAQGEVVERREEHFNMV